MHPLDRRTDELIQEFIATMDEYGIPELPQSFGTWPDDPDEWVAPMANVRTRGWYIPTKFGPAPGFVVTRDATLYPLIQAADLADGSVPSLPYATLPRVTENPGLAGWTSFFHSCIAAAGEEYLDCSTRAESLDDRMGIITSAFRSRMYARQIPPSRQTFVQIDHELLDLGPDVEADPLPNVEITGWLVKAPADRQFTDCYGLPLHPANCSYVITPRGESFLLRQPASLDGVDQAGPVKPTVAVPRPSDEPFLGPLEPDVRGDAAHGIENYIAVVCAALDDDAKSDDATPATTCR
jgi:hypothetical protein